MHDPHPAALLPRTARTRPRTAGQARDLARDFLSGGFPRPEPEAAENVLLVVSELVTNALRHGGGLVDVRLRGTDGGVAVEVRDPSPVVPRERSGDLGGATGGFGWPLVRRLAREVTVSPEPGGKTVCATLAL